MAGRDTGVRIDPITLGITDCWLIQGDGIILVDTGVPNKATRFERCLRNLAIRPEDIRLIVITHGHYDHIGSARDIKAITGAPIAMHHEERVCLEKGRISMPPGVTPWGRLLIKMRGVAKTFIRVPETDVDIGITEKGLSLSEYGIPGRVIPTPGHTGGSVSVLLESGEAFVGDLAMNKVPLRFTPGLPIFAEDIHRVKESWQKLMETGAESIYPGHGKPFSIDVIRKAL